MTSNLLWLEKSIQETDITDDLLFSTSFSHQMTPLHLAAETGRIKILRYFIDQGADINIQDDNGVSILWRTYQLVLLEYLIEFELASFPGRYCIHFSVFKLLKKIDKK